MRMPFGKFKGMTLDELPDDYLDWLLTRDLSEILTEALLRESDRRAGSAPIAILIQPCDLELMRLLVDLGYRAAARSLHPDSGGDGEAMIRLNGLAESLRRQLPERVKI